MIKYLLILCALLCSTIKAQESIDYSNDKINFFYKDLNDVRYVTATGKLNTLTKFWRYYTEAEVEPALVATTDDQLHVLVLRFTSEYDINALINAYNLFIEKEFIQKPPLKISVVQADNRSPISIDVYGLKEQVLKFAKEHPKFDNTVVHNEFYSYRQSTRQEGYSTITFKLHTKEQKECVWAALNAYFESCRKLKYECELVR